MTDKEKIRAEIERRMKASAKIEEEYKGIDKDLSAKAQLKAAEYQSMLVFIDSMQEEPVSEDLEKEMDYLSKRYPEVSFAKLSRIAVHVANWQKKQCNNEANHALVEQIKTQQLCYEKGMADMKQQMMKTAVDKRIETNFLRAYLCLYVDELGFETGDEVKVIIIKEE